MLWWRRQVILTTQQRLGELQKYPLFFSAYIQGWGYFELHYYQLTVNFHQIGYLQNDLLANIAVLMVKFLYV